MLMACKKGIWTETEIEFLKENYLSMTVSKCAKYLKRSKPSIYQKAMQLGLRRERRYCDAEIAIIIAGYQDYGPLELSKKLDRSNHAIRDMAVRFGLNVSKQRLSNRGMENRAKWTDESMRKKIKANRKYRGPLSPSWKGGCCTLNELTRARLHSVWIKPIIIRDDRKCVLCGEYRSKKIVVHHIRTFATIRDLVIEQNKHLLISNYNDLSELADLIVAEHKYEDGITLCKTCHKKHHLENGVNCGNIQTGKTEDNPQPSRSNVIDFVDRKVQRLMGEDITTNKPDTSAPHTFPYGVMR